MDQCSKPAAGTLCDCPHPDPLFCPEHWVGGSASVIPARRHCSSSPQLPVFNTPVFTSQKIPSSFSINSSDTLFSLFRFLFRPSQTVCYPFPPSKAITLLPLYLYLHDTEVLSEAGQDGKRQAFTKRLRFNMFSLAFHFSPRASQQN